MILIRKLEKKPVASSLCFANLRHSERPYFFTNFSNCKNAPPTRTNFY